VHSRRRYLAPHLLVGTQGAGKVDENLDRNKPMEVDAPKAPPPAAKGRGKGKGKR
jgi:hypothetical protein